MRAVHILSDGREVDRIDGYVIKGDTAVRLTELLRRKSNASNKRNEPAATVRGRGNS